MARVIRKTRSGPTAFLTPGDEIGQHQTELNFRTHSAKDGLASWRRERERMMRGLAKKLGLPVGHEAKVQLKDGVIVSGKLRIADVASDVRDLSHNKLALEIDGFVFAYGELESCVRLD